MANMNSKTSEYSLALTAEEMKEIETAREMPITFDDDCPETTPERAIKPVEKSAGFILRLA